MINNIKEEVNHPTRYNGECSLECIEVMKLVFGVEIVIWFCLCNAFKYLWRHKSKNKEQDVNKAEWYLNYTVKTNKYSKKQYTTYKILKDMLSKAKKYYIM